MATWHGDVARHLRETAELLERGQALQARRSLEVALGYLLKAATHGDDEAFQWLSRLRDSVDQSEPTQVLDLDAIEGEK